MGARVRGDSTRSGVGHTAVRPCVRQGVLCAWCSADPSECRFLRGEGEQRMSLESVSHKSTHPPALPTTSPAHDPTRTSICRPSVLLARYMLLLHAGTFLLPILFAMGSHTLLIPRVHISQCISTEVMVGSTISYANTALIISRCGSSPLKSTRWPWMQPQCLRAHRHLIGTPHIPNTLQPSHSTTAETHSSRLRRTTHSGCIIARLAS